MIRYKASQEKKPRNNPTKSDCSKKNLSFLKGKLISPQKKFSSKFFSRQAIKILVKTSIYFGPNVFIFAGSLPAPEGSPHSCKHPIPPSTLGRDPLPHPKPRGAHPNTSHSQILGIQTQLPKHSLQQPPLSSHFMSFLPLSLVFKGEALAGRRVSPVPPRTDYTGCGFQFYIVCPFLALITLINQMNL